jgi:GNAT superfamily N-acetyltransferase
MRRELPGGYELDDDPARIDVDAVHRYLAEESYWAHGRPRDVVEDLVHGASRVVGLYYIGLGDRINPVPETVSLQVGFARTFSDGHTLSYLADVYVLPEHRGRGLGVELVREAVEHSPFVNTRWLLHTRDAHELYRKFGFGAVSARLMEKTNG